MDFLCVKISDFNRMFYVVSVKVQAASVKRLNQGSKLAFGTTI